MPADVCYCAGAFASDLRLGVSTMIHIQTIRLVMVFALTPVFCGLFCFYPAGAQSPVDGSRGERLYLSQCAMCHGQKGEGGRGPTLARPKLLHAPDDNALRGVIRGGIPGAGMPGSVLIETEIRD